MMPSESVWPQECQVLIMNMVSCLYKKLQASIMFGDVCPDKMADKQTNQKKHAPWYLTRGHKSFMADLWVLDWYTCLYLYHFSRFIEHKEKKENLPHTLLRTGHQSIIYHFIYISYHISFRTIICSNFFLFPTKHKSSNTDKP